MKESDMYKPIKDFLLEELGCRDVFAEVSGYDVLGIMGEIDIIVELKKNMSFKVIEQARRGAGRADYVFVAIPKPKQALNIMATRLLKQEGVGLIYVTEKGAAIQFWGRRNRRKRSLRKNILPHHRHTIGGVKSGEGPTEYSVTIERIKTFLRRNGWSTIESILENVETHYKHPKPSVMATLRASWNEDWCERKSENGKTYFRLKKGGTI